jgi:hypothetical protein
MTSFMLFFLLIEIILQPFFIEEEEEEEEIRKVSLARNMEIKRFDCDENIRTRDTLSYKSSDWRK